MSAVSTAANSDDDNTDAPADGPFVVQSSWEYGNFSMQTGDEGDNSGSEPLTSASLLVTVDLPSSLNHGAFYMLSVVVVNFQISTDSGAGGNGTEPNATLQAGEENGGVLAINGSVVVARALPSQGTFPVVAKRRWRFRVTFLQSMVETIAYDRNVLPF